MNTQAAAVSRRDFLRTTTAATATAVAANYTGVFGAGTERIRVGLVGCGARGTGAAMNCAIADPAVEIVALADVFPDKIQECLKRLKDNRAGKEWSCSREWKDADRVKVTADTCFSGFDGYERLLKSGVDYVILAGPPHFRPGQLKAAVEAGKHVFMEKPVGVDPVGIRSIIATSELAAQRGLGIVAGTQRRHQASYVETLKRVRDGAIGEVVAGEAYWNGPCVRTYGFYHERESGWTDFEYMMRNWYFYAWLSGDHIVEQHVHNLDVINWAIGTPPSEVVAVGGRQWRVEPQYGNIYDHFGARYRYPNQAVVVSMARQINNTEGRVSEGVIGTKGRASAGRIEGEKPWRYAGPNPNPYEQEHADLIASIRAGKPLNEGRPVAEATLTAIMARMSAYSGQPVTWEFALKESELDLTPAEIKTGGYKLGPAPTVPAPASGNADLI
jgi:predicted dehydrogenase